MCFKTIKETVVDKVKDVFGHPPVEKSGIERASPKGRIENVKWNNTTKMVEFGPFDEKPWITTVADTNSMEPLIDKPFTSVLIKADPADLEVGDVCVYSTGYNSIIHAIVQITLDTVGRLFKFKGYNNKGADPWKVRDEHIKHVLVCLLYTSPSPRDRS